MSIQSMTPEGVAFNGHSNGHPSLSTLPQLLDRLNDARDELDYLVRQGSELVDVTEQALTFIDRRVEMARARERRRDRRRGRS